MIGQVSRKMGEELPSLVGSTISSLSSFISNRWVEHTLLVTEDGVEILTAREEDSPGGPVPMPATGSNGDTESHDRSWKVITTAP